MLTDRERKFVSAYAGPGSGLAAARAAGYTGSDATLRVTASRLLDRPAIMAALETRGARVRKAPASRPSTSSIVSEQPSVIDATPARADIADDEEIAAILTRIARDSESDETRIKACAALSKARQHLQRSTADTSGPTTNIVIVLNNRGPQAAHG